MSRKKKLIVIDCETDPFKIERVPEPFVWGCFDGETFEYFWGEDCTQDLCEFIYNEDVVVYAHNGGKFDFFFLLPWLEREKITVINGRISQAHIGKALLKDSYNIIPIPLSAYKKDDFEYWKMEVEHREKHKKEILRYLENDCRYLYELVEAFINRFGAKLTLASAAMKNLSNTVKVKTGKSFDKFSKFEDSVYREFYYGGRCQAFETGELKGEYKIFDINSAYPRAMMDEHPSPIYKGFDILKTQRLPEKGPYFAIIEAVSYGALPYRDEKDLRLSFPCDKTVRKYHVTGWEIQAGLETGTLKIKRVLEIRVPRKTMNFKEYVDFWYNEKVNCKLSGDKIGDKIGEIFAKLMLNSAYGKFALNPDEFKEYKIVNYGDYPDENDNSDGFDDFELDSTWPDYGIDIYKRDDPQEFGYFNVSIAASITGWVRAYLWRAVCNSVDVAYCDTDSLVCRDFFGELSETILGAWKYEGTSNEGYIAGRKLYALYIGDENKNDRYDYKYLMKKYKQENFIRASKKAGWKLASKGARLLPHELKHIASSDEAINWHNDAPTFSLRHNVRFIQRKIRKIV